MVKELTAKCGKTGFRTIQGLQGHERMCSKCQSEYKKNGLMSTKKESTQQPENKAPKNNYRLLSDEEKELIDSQGRRLGDLYDTICDQTGELR